MKTNVYYLMILISLFIALFFFKQRGLFLPILPIGVYNIQEATISNISESVIESVVKVDYTYNGKLYSDEVSYSEGDDLGDEILIYLSGDNKYIYRMEFVKQFNLFSIMLLLIIVLILIELFLVVRYKLGYYKNKLYIISYGFHFVFFRGVYAAARGNNIGFLLYIFLVWFQAMIVVSFIGRQYELTERNRELLKQFSVREQD